MTVLENQFIGKRAQFLTRVRRGSVREASRPRNLARKRSPIAPDVLNKGPLMFGRVGMVSGLFFGLAFGMGGIGAAVLGEPADWTSLELVYRVCSFPTLIGLLALFLPNPEEARAGFHELNPGSASEGVHTSSTPLRIFRLAQMHCLKKDP